jgi:hypothetical protein
MAPIGEQERLDSGFSLFQQLDFERGYPVKGLCYPRFGLDDDGTICTVVDLATAMGMVKVASV